MCWRCARCLARNVVGSVEILAMTSGGLSCGDALVHIGPSRNPWSPMQPASEKNTVITTMSTEWGCSSCLTRTKQKKKRRKKKRYIDHSRCDALFLNWFSLELLFSWTGSLWSDALFLNWFSLKWCSFLELVLLWCCNHSFFLFFCFLF